MIIHSLHTSGFVTLGALAATWKALLCGISLKSTVRGVSTHTGKAGSRPRAVEILELNRSQSDTPGKPGESEEKEKMCLKQMPW